MQQADAVGRALATVRKKLGLVDQNAIGHTNSWPVLSVCLIFLAGKNINVHDKRSLSCFELAADRIACLYKSSLPYQTIVADLFQGPCS